MLSLLLLEEKEEQKHDESLFTAQVVVVILCICICVRASGKPTMTMWQDLSKTFFFRISRLQKRAAKRFFFKKQEKKMK